MVINSGNFSGGNNFSAYNTKGERIHIHGRQMEALGYKPGDTITYPFFVIAENKTYGARPVLDDNGKPVLNADGTQKLLPYADGKFTMTRATATAVFKTKEDYINAYVLDKTLEAEVANAVKREMNAVGITSHAELEALLG
jgi:hypothetical protein